MKQKPIRRQVAKPRSILSSLTKTNDANGRSGERNVSNESKSKCVLSINNNEIDDDDNLQEKVPQEKTITPTLSTIITPLTRKELLEKEIINYMKIGNPPKPKKNRKAELAGKTVVLESVNKLSKNSEYVVTETPPQENQVIYLYDQYNNVVNKDMNIIGVYYNKKVYLVESD